MAAKKSEPEFRILVNDERDYPEAQVVLAPGEYGHLHFDLLGNNPSDPGLFLRGCQQLGFIMTKPDALALARAIREYYGIKDEESSGAAQ